MKRPTDKPIHIVAKSAMTAVYLWSGFFWSGVAILNFWLNDPSDSHLSVGFLAGSLILLVSLILCWLRLYILQIIPCIAGLAVYLKPAREMMDRAARLTEVTFKPTFEQRYMPIIGFALLSLALFIARIWQIFSARAEKKREFNDLPAESILEKRRDE